MKQFIDKLIERLEEAGQSVAEAKPTIVGRTITHRYYKAISTKKAIDIVNQLAEEHKDDIQTIDVSELLGESVNDGWIPCSERLPDDFMSFEYLTIRKGHTLATITYYCVVNHKWYSNRNSTREIEVIAWQPLPNPFKPIAE